MSNENNCIVKEEMEFPSVSTYAQGVDAESEWEIPNEDVGTSDDEPYKAKGLTTHKTKAKKLVKRPCKRSSMIWNVFTIVDNKNCTAACNICGVKLSFKSTVTNLRSHLKNKHSCETDKRLLTNLFLPKKKNDNVQKTLTEMAGVEHVVLDVVSEDIEQVTQTDNGVPVIEVMQDSFILTNEGEAHNYHIESPEKEAGGYTPSTSRKKQIYKAPSRIPRLESDEGKKRRVLDLQLECLEIKKYTMQMEALLLEQQLQLPRSVYTQPLREVDVYSRSTQTDVGGEDTRVFYVSDKDGASQGPHIFSFRSRPFK